MADVAQVIYEYTAGNTLSFFTEDLEVEQKRLFMTVTPRPDGKIYVDDPGKPQKIFTCSAIITGDDLNTLNTVQTGSITYSGAYPRLTTINLDGNTTLTNIEVALTNLTWSDLGFGKWRVRLEFTEKTD